jgi:hypothetical protein
VQRNCQVPVQSYQKVAYWQPQTTCCTTTQGTPIMAGPGGPPTILQGTTQPPAATTAPNLPSPPPANTPPNIGEQRSLGTGASNPMYDRYYPPTQPQGAPAMPPASWKPQPSSTTPASVPASPQPSVRLDSIVLGDDQPVDGQVVRVDNSPRPNAKVTFVSALSGQRFTTTANSAGRFNVNLPAGGWLLYTYGADDLPRYSNRIDVGGTRQPGLVTLVSR